MEWIERVGNLRSAARTQVLALTGRSLIGPQSGCAGVAPEHIRWHTAQVFRGEARAAEGV
ncbi:hypothetical protein Stube_22790 [Streptomyces tubercidicus]|uniref:Uncharacterized protein n=1 Tax=Streptomyces tubercidicus TaxID=47759 RepID=A0A640UU50_9ACTN|nr:hypothetical protein [Streptomyces tubercidicus]GFE37606.1 hypothetical protein Stube_22790 [Streptomyces tubercidicus]